jgi:predicted nucleotidyltransferase
MNTKPVEAELKKVGELIALITQRRAEWTAELEKLFQRRKSLDNAIGLSLKIKRDPIKEVERSMHAEILAGEIKRKITRANTQLKDLTQKRTGLQRGISRIP